MKPKKVRLKHEIDAIRPFRLRKNRFASQSQINAGIEANGQYAPSSSTAIFATFMEIFSNTKDSGKFAK